TAGFYSKDQILWYAWSASNGNGLLWAIALVGAFITALYSTRLMLVVFWGATKTPVVELPGRLMTIPLVILAILSITAGFIEWPHNLVHVTLVSDLVQKVLPATVLKQNVPEEIVLQGIAVLVTLLGIYSGYALYYRNAPILEIWKQSRTTMGLRNFFYKGWAFDQIYDVVFVKPFVYITRINKSDVFDLLNKTIAAISLWLNQGLSVSQNGSLRWYVAGVLIGIIFILTLQLFL